MTKNLVIALIVCGLWIAAFGGVAAGDELAAVPDVAARADAAKKVADLYAVDIAAATRRAAKAELAHKLVKDAAGEKDSVVKYCILEKAIELGELAADPDAVMAGVEAMAAGFAVDQVKLIVEHGTRLIPELDEKGLVAMAKRVLDQADKLCLAEKYDVADKLADLALSSARSATVANDIRPLVARGLEIKELEKGYAEAGKWWATLASDPKNATANLNVGKFYCLVKGDWDKGLPMLAASADATGLKLLAKKELDKPEGVKLAAVADGWCAWAGGQNGTYKYRVLKHAAMLYEAAAGGMSENDKATALTKKDEAAKAACPWSPHGTLLGAPWKATINFCDEKAVKKDFDLHGKTPMGRTGLEMFGPAGEAKSHKMLTGDFDIRIECSSPDVVTVSVADQTFDVGTPKRWASIKRTGGKIMVANDSNNNKVVELTGDLDAPCPLTISFKVEFSPTPKALEVRQVKIDGFAIGQ